MTVKKQELCNLIETLPEEFSNKILDYIEYLKYSAIINNAPENLIIKDKEDLKNKILEGIEDSGNGKVCNIDEAFKESKLENISNELLGRRYNDEKIRCYGCCGRYDYKFSSYGKRSKLLRYRQCSLGRRKGIYKQRIRLRAYGRRYRQRWS